MRGPHVVVAGAGAMGCLFGGLLSENGLRVTLLARREEHVAAIRERGLRIVGEGGARHVPIGAATSTAGVAPADIVFIQCKAHATQAVSESIAPLMVPGSVAVSFQNGLGNEDVMAQVLGSEAVLGGLTSLGATLEAPGVVRSYATLPTVIGEMSGGLSPRAEALAALLTAHGLPTSASDDILTEKWRKLMLNVAMSATSGLTGLTIGGVAGLASLAAVARRAMDEAAAVAEASGISLPNETRYQVFDGIVDSGAARNKTSMRRDIEAGRPSEVEAIYLSVIERGRDRAVPTPTLEALSALVIGLEAARRADGG
ncbi:MAG: ketopantoate reductase family protein [Bosea sp. (in: a-proteobacteria)]|uniref:ketopantoate reductase family protein n=1 Tax=Bosea sp. (in: a-proteobacteria) TaxID=1871050 RepID=UPI0027357977|nr:ketopantoate reductase family protein [Bosea sp. (in: a-proteobacteria)]MDP3256246.1 ketopantoate reductase family protein [Bosea sp. (in: a-proteobacteria)]MDP3317655.1 ketopantoate reductase family protein [Bosea sp. (in: a-proteobacteria)]